MLEKTLVQKVFLSERIDRFTHNKLGAPRKTLNEQFIMGEYESQLANILFFTTYFGTVTDQALFGVTLYTLGIIASTRDYYFGSKELPESRKK